MTILKKILTWIFVSSKNPTQVSRTLQAATLTFVAAWLPVLPLIHITVDSATIITIIQSGYAVLQAFLVLVGATGTLVFALEKVVKTANGTNAALKKPVLSSVSITNTGTSAGYSVTSSMPTATAFVQAQDPTNPIVQ